MTLFHLQLHNHLPSDLSGCYNGPNKSTMRKMRMLVLLYRLKYLLLLEKNNQTIFINTIGYFHTLTAYIYHLTYAVVVIMGLLREPLFEQCCNTILYLCGRDNHYLISFQAFFVIRSESFEAWTTACLWCIIFFLEPHLRLSYLVV